MFFSRGFTLIELLLYTLLIGITLLTVSGLLFLLMATRTKNATIAEVEQQGAFAMGLMTQTVRSATGITVPVTGTSGTLLMLTVPAGANNPTVFDVSGGALRISEGTPAAVNFLTSTRVTLSALTFQNLSRSGTNGTIRIQFTLSSVNNNGRNEYSFTKTFYGSATVR